MNNKGQTLIIFVIVLPVLLLFTAFFIDLSLVSLNHNKIDGSIRDNLEIILKDNIKDENKIKKVFQENKINISKITITDNEIEIDVNQQIDSLFGNIVKFKIYRIEETYIGNYQTNKINVR